VSSTLASVFFHRFIDSSIEAKIKSKSVRSALRVARPPSAEVEAPIGWVLTHRSSILALARVARGAWRVARGAWRVARGAWRKSAKPCEASVGLMVGQDPPYGNAGSILAPVLVWLSPRDA
jgi:hypothetical protein